MLGDRLVEGGDALAFGGVFGEAFEAAGGPEGFALGFEALEVEVGHQSWVRPLAPMYSSPPASSKRLDISAMPASASSNSVRPEIVEGLQWSSGADEEGSPSTGSGRTVGFCSCSRANSRTSWLIFIEQNLGPHMLQKCAVLAPSAGRVWSWKASAVSGSSDRL